MGLHEVKAHEQIIYRSMSYLAKLPEVRQVQGESILFFWCHQKSDTIPKVVRCQKRRKAIASLHTSNELLGYLKVESLGFY